MDDATLLDDANATAEPEVDESKPPAEDRDVRPPTTPTLRRSERLRKKANAAVAEVATSKMIERPRRKKAAPARLAGPRAAPSKKAAPSASVRRSTRARSKPIRYVP